MKRFIFACCLLALAASLQVPQDKLQPITDPAKDSSSKFSPASSPESARAHNTFGNASDHDIAHATSTDSGSGSGHDAGSSSDSKMKRSEESKGPAISVRKLDAVAIKKPINDNTTPLSYAEEDYTTDIFDWDDV